MARVTLSRAEILRTLDTLGGAASLAPILSLLPGASAGASGIASLLATCETELRAGPVTVTIAAPLGGTTTIEIA